MYGHAAGGIFHGLEARLGGGLSDRMTVSPQEAVWEE